MSEFKLLRGKEMDLEYGIKVYPLTLGEIEEIGENNYNAYLNSLLVTKSNVKQEDVNPDMWAEFQKMTDFEFILLNAAQSLEFRGTITSSLTYFLREVVVFDDEYGLFIKRESESVLINAELFDKMKDLISKQNFIKESKEEKEEYNPHDAKAKELIEKINKYKKLIQEQNAEDGLNLGDIISIVASNSPNYNFINVWDLTVYQLYTVYLRVMKKDQYETQIYLLPHSSSENRQKMNHWASKLDK